MISDMKPEPAEERVARSIMSAALGVEVESHDDNSADGMVDFVFLLPDGRRGAAEMTAITDPVAREWTALAKKQISILNSSWAWTVRRRGGRVTRQELAEHLPYLAACAEAVNDPEVRNLLSGAPQGHPSLTWLATSGVEIRGLRSTNNPGMIYLEPDSEWSFAPEDFDLALGWIEEQLTKSAFDRKFAKLAATGADEQHLVLRLDVGAAVPFEHWSAVVSSSVTLPRRDPVVRGRNLTGLWLLPDFGTSIVYWTSTLGWQRAQT